MALRGKGDQCSPKADTVRQSFATKVLLQRRLALPARTRLSVSVHDNFAQHNTFGVLYRNSGGGSITHNTLSHNCAGLARVLTPRGFHSAVTIQTNTVRTGNTAFCFSDDAGPESGAGIRAQRARADFHRPEQQRPVPMCHEASHIAGRDPCRLTGEAGLPASHNTITGNTALHNSPDLYWDGFGIQHLLGPPLPDERPELALPLVGSGPGRGRSPPAAAGMRRTILPS